MAELRNDEFKRLLTLNKFFIDAGFIPPQTGQAKSFELRDSSGREKFFLDINRSGTIELKEKVQNRYLSYALVRLELNGPPHTNPNGEKVSRNHIHVYQEGFGDSWAYELPDFEGVDFKKCNTFEDYLISFCEYCNIRITELQVTM